LANGAGEWKAKAAKGRPRGDRGEKAPKKLKKNLKKKLALP
jgi:hypothetical protein